MLNECQFLLAEPSGLLTLPPQSLWFHTHSPAAPASGGLCQPACRFWRRIWRTKNQQSVGPGRVGKVEMSQLGPLQENSSSRGSNRSYSFRPAHLGSVTDQELTLCGRFQTWFLCFGSPAWSPGGFGWCLVWRADQILQEWEKTRSGSGSQGSPEEVETEAHSWPPLPLCLQFRVTATRGW